MWHNMADWFIIPHYQSVFFSPTNKDLWWVMSSFPNRAIEKAFGRQRMQVIWIEKKNPKLSESEKFSELISAPKAFTHTCNASINEQSFSLTNHPKQSVHFYFLDGLTLFLWIKWHEWHLKVEDLDRPCLWNTACTWESCHLMNKTDALGTLSVKSVSPESQGW